MTSRSRLLDRLTVIPDENRYPVIWVLLLIGILMIGAYFRFTGVNWDENQHLHPDERFMTMVASSVSSVDSLENYFDTSKSTLNPHNVGYGFYVYGTLPLFLVRWVAEAVKLTGYDEIFLVGRVLSGLADLFSVLLVYLTAMRLFNRQRLALIAAAFMAMAVMPIQLSHYFTVDNFANLFTLLAIYFAVRVFTAPLPPPGIDGEEESFAWRDLIGYRTSVVPYLLFGVGLGLALASKVSIAPLAAMLPLAAVVYFFRLSPQRQNKFALVIFRNLVLGAIVAFIFFRIFQPYAFTGPGFFGIGLNQKWFDNLSTLQAQSSGDVDSPPELQWARRPITFAWTNMVQWGLGTPLGLLAWAGFLWMGWCILRGEWKKYLLIWGWTGAYFAWQALSFTRTMRYQIPVYPTLAIIAAWALFALWDHCPKENSRIKQGIIKAWPKVLSLLLGLVVLGTTFAWAFAFTRIYNRPMTRVEATRWIFDNVPAPINVQLQTGTGVVNQPLPYLNDGSIEPEKPYSFTFKAPSTGVLSEISLPGLVVQQAEASPIFLYAEVTDITAGNKLLSSGSLPLAFNTKDQVQTISLDTLVPVLENQIYGVTIHIKSQHSSALLTKDIVIKVFTRYSEEKLPVNNITLQGTASHVARFTPRLGGSLSVVRLPVKGVATASKTPVLLSLTVMESRSNGKVAGAITQLIEASSEGETISLRFEPALPLLPLQEYLIVIENTTIGQIINLNGSMGLRMVDDSVSQTVAYPVRLIRPGNPYLAMYEAKQDGLVSEITFGRVAQQDPTLPGKLDLSVEITMMQRGDAVLGSGKLQTTLDTTDPRGTSVTVLLDHPVEVKKGTDYFIRIASNKGAVALRGSAPANESSWDDGLPLRMDGYDGFSGMYQRELNFEMYWNDNQEKLERFKRVLDSADYIFITSNRQWGTTTRVQERYPLTSAYYRNLLGCPADKEITWCYSVAEPGQFESNLGFDLVKVFQSDPSLGALRFNSQFAEEAFTVYDHPKVLIFQKRADYSSKTVNEILNVVDLSKVKHVTPRKAGVPANLLLPDYLQGQQQAGGTWAELFNPDLIYNRFPVLALVLWYLAVSLLGWICYPMVRLALGGLADKGYPVVRLVGLLVLAYLSWLAGSSGLTFSQPTIWLIIGLIVAVNAALFIAQKDVIRKEWTQKNRYFLAVEAVTLAFFVFFLLIRIGNPDLWHPAKGGEKPMDFSYFNAILKSTSFPPYDPWFAGGYINYYYYGFVVAGVLVKALGITPSVAYNLLLPTFFSMVATGAFSVGWNLLSKGWQKGDEVDEPERDGPLHSAPWIAGLSSAIGVLILGNLGTVKMAWEGLQRLVVAEEVMAKADIFSRLGWTLQGLVKFFGGNGLPYSRGEWYWNPSRAIPGDPITEFPFFSFLYGDPHAHMWALPVTLLAVVWAISILRTRWDWNIGQKTLWGIVKFGLSLLLGGLTIGALRPMNTWDLPTYLVLGMLALIVSAQPFKQHWWKGLLSAGALAGLAFLLYQPFATWYGQGYNAIDLWKGDLTPEWAYTMHWGVFLFIITSWMTWETIDWMAKTPVSALNAIKRRLGFFIGLLVGIIALIVALLLMKIQPAWIIVLIGAWAVALMLRRGQSLAKRAVLFMTGSALVLTLAVELVVLVGDIGRMNTVFKFYLQAWTLLALSAAAALVWVWPAVQTAWNRRWSAVWTTLLSLLVIGAALYPIMAGMEKVIDRMSQDAPVTLDGMAYMESSRYSDQGVDMLLGEDYHAIQWMQKNIKGSPVIVEASVPEYRWGTRFTINTGLPGVVGWNWHQRQQRALTPSEWVSDRVDAIGLFYRTTDPKLAKQFLSRFGVRYIILGQLERAYFPGKGLAKFESQNGSLWQEVYREGSTVIYEVLE